VPKFHFSHRAEADLFNIRLNTFRTWGEIQTDRYIRQLEDCCQLLGDNPALGRAYADYLLARPKKPALTSMQAGRPARRYQKAETVSIAEPSARMRVAWRKITCALSAEANTTSYQESFVSCHCLAAIKSAGLIGNVSTRVVLPSPI
jgi:plasmid stabilization system protein ParE